MNYQIDRTLHTPAYIQLYHLLVRDITSGLYPYGARLPSKRTVAEEAGISVITAEHAYALLIDEGYAETKERSGCYVIYRGTDYPAEPGVAPPSIPQTKQTPHARGEFPYTVLARTVRKVLTVYADSLEVRSPNAGCAELRAEICRYLARSRGIAVNSSQVIIGSGAEYLYGLIAQLIGRDRVIAVENPCYDKILKVYASMGIICDPLTLTAEGISSKALGRTRASALHVTPFNSYPSGITADISKKREYVCWAEERRGLLIEDNYDSELTVSRKPEETLFSLAGGKRVIYLNTFSRTIAPSMRIGYMILPEELEEEYENKLGFYSCSVPVLEQYLLTELLRNGDFERHINRIRRKKRQEMKQGGASQ